jgi:hypothetical protein
MNDIGVLHRMFKTSGQDLYLMLQKSIPSEYLSTYLIGRRKPHTPLIAVILKQQYKTYDLQQHKNKPVVVFCQKSYEVAHALSHQE